MNDKLKIAINLCGHLRGYKNISYIKNFFESYDINIINKALNYSYKTIEIQYYLYTVEEINININHKRYIQTVFPEKYREYTLIDFNEWLNHIKNKIIFKNICIVKKDKFYQNIESLYRDLIKKDINNCLNLSDVTISMFLKREESLKLIDNDCDIIFNIRPDLIFKYELNSKFNDFNDIIIQILNEKSTNSIYVPLLNSTCLYNVISNDFYHYGLKENIHKFFKDMISNNLLLYNEFNNLDNRKFPLIYKIIGNYIRPHYGELKQMINYKLGNVMVKPSNHISTDLEMIDTPFDIHINQYETVYGHVCNKI